MNRIIFTQDGIIFRKTLNILKNQIDPDISRNSNQQQENLPNYLLLQKRCKKNINIINKAKVSRSLSTSKRQQDSQIVRNAGGKINSSLINQQRYDQLEEDPEIDLSRFALYKPSSVAQQRKSIKQNNMPEQSDHHYYNLNLNIYKGDETQSEIEIMNQLGMQSSRIQQRQKEYDRVRDLTKKKLEQAKNDQSQRENKFYEMENDEFFNHMKKSRKKYIDSNELRLKGQEDRYQRQLLANSSFKYYKQWQQVGELKKKKEFESTEERSKRIKQKMEELKLKYKLKHQAEFKDLEPKTDRERESISQTTSNPILKFLIHISPSKRQSIKTMQNNLAQRLNQINY